MSVHNNCYIMLLMEECRESINNQENLTVEFIDSFATTSSSSTMNTNSNQSQQPQVRS